MDGKFEYGLTLQSVSFPAQAQDCVIRNTSQRAQFERCIKRYILQIHTVRLGS